MSMVDGLLGPTPVVVSKVKVTSFAPCETGRGNEMLPVCSSFRPNGTFPRFVLPVVAVTLPLQPVLPVPQVSCRATRSVGVGKQRRGGRGEQRREHDAGGRVVAVRVEAAVELEDAGW